VFSDPNIKKIGHTLQSDIKLLSTQMDTGSLQQIIDISQLFKLKYPNEKQCSLAFMTKHITGKQISKF
jgi:ribonuclease D